MTALVLTILLFWIAFFHALPAVLVISSGRVRGNDQTLWIFAVLFTSWLGFVAFMVVTTLDSQKKPVSAAQLRQSRNLPVLDISDQKLL